MLAATLARARDTGRPAVALTFRPTDATNLRFSASQTVSRPEYRELAPIMYREVIGFDNVFGNPNVMQRSEYE